MPKRCYNCGISFNDLIKKERTKEHFPAQTHFNGYEEKYKLNRKTVPACLDCNNGYSDNDHYVRDAVGVLNENDPQKIELTKQSLRNILADKKNIENRMSVTEKGLFFEFDIEKLDANHKKNFKCIYTKSFSKPLDKDFSIDVYSDGHEMRKFELGKVFLKELVSLGNWQISGHKDVFSYKLAEIDIENNSLIEIKNETDPKFMAAAMMYNKTLTALVIAAKPEIKELTKT